MRRLWNFLRIDFIAGLCLACLPGILYPLAATRQGVFFVGDILRLYYPQRAVYVESLRRGTLPFWTPDIWAGYPLLAEGQTGVFYPLNLLLYAILPIDVALNYSILLALSLAGVATYVLGRQMRMTPPAAGLMALVFTYGGFFTGHFNHLNIMAAAPWLPLALVLVERGVGNRAARPRSDIRFGAALALVSGLQFLAGHPQIWLMSMLVVVAYGLFRAVWLANRPGRGRVPVGHHLVLLAGAIGGGLALAAVQVFPTWELVQWSVRAGGVSRDFFSSFSWHPALLGTLLVPFALGNPYPRLSVEMAAYLGMLPLLLAAMGLILGRDRRVIFWAGLAGVALLLAFGEYTPLYTSLARVPIFNLFRVPARFLYLFSLAVAVLAGHGMDALLGRYPPALQGEAGRAGSGPGISSSLPIRPWRAFREESQWLLLLVGALAGLQRITLETLLALRWVTPFLWLLLAGGWVGLVWRRRGTRRRMAWAALSLVMIDLAAFAAVYRWTYNDLMPLTEFYTEPASIRFFPAETHTYRTYTHQAIVPDISVMRPSLYPNTSLLYGIPSANGYFPLTPARHEQYLTKLTPTRLNLLNARYFLIPQLLPVDPATEEYDLHNPFMPDPVDRALAIPPTPTEQIELVSFTSQSAAWPQGDLVATLVLTDTAGHSLTFPIRAGLETAEWAYDRADVREQIAHARPPVAYSWPARSGFPPQEHPGHAFRAIYTLPTPVEVTQVQVVPARPAGLVHIMQLDFVRGDRRHSLARLTGYGRHRLAYRDPDVVIYENLDALPRAFVVTQAYTVPDDAAALAVMDQPGFRPCETVVLVQPRGEILRSSTESLQSEGEDPGRQLSRAVFQPGPTACVPAIIRHYQPRQVEMEATLTAPGYLVFLDSFYPGWEVVVNGEPAPLLRADLIFRAVALPAGTHQVVFRYTPFTLRWGATISALALLGWGGLVVWGWVGGGESRASRQTDSHI